MKFKKVHQADRQRFYKADEPIFVTPKINSKEKMREALAYAKERLKDEYKHLVPKRSLKYVCVSDAKTHTERLVFGAVYEPRSGRYTIVTDLWLDGDMTFMICGGDERTIRSDETYLKRIIKLHEEIER